MSFDGLKLFYRAWEKHTSNALIIVHGFGEHSGRYSHFVEELLTLPISIFLHDLRGQGHSEGQRVYVQSFDEMVEDLWQFRAFIENKKGAEKRNFILLGQSLGGLIATAAALRNQAAWRALVLLSPFFGVPFAHKALDCLAMFLNFVGPKRVLNNPIRPMFLTRDTEELERYKRDQLVQRRITFRMAREMFKGCASVWKKINELELPLLLLASGEDRIVSIQKSREFFETIRSQRKEMKVFDGFLHELLHERNREQPIAQITSFLIHFGLY